MKGTPIVTAERIERYRIRLRFANGESQIWTFSEGDGSFKPENVSFEMMSAVCLFALKKLGSEIGVWLDDDLDPFGRPISKGN